MFIYHNGWFLNKCRGEARYAQMEDLRAERTQPPPYPTMGRGGGGGGAILT